MSELPERYKTCRLVRVKNGSFYDTKTKTKTNS